MKLKRSRTSKRGRIEIIPMIDVMFFLLVTFMLTSLSMQRLDAFKLDLPQGRARPMTLQQPLTLNVTKTGQIQVNRETVRLDQVAAAVKGRVGPDGNIVVAADSAAANGLVVQAILQARQGGAEHVLIAIQRDE